MKRLPATIVMEMAALSAGIIMVGLELAVLINRDWLGRAAVELFRGGEPLAIIVVLAMVVGFLALVLFAINLVAGRRALWWQRCILAVGFLLTVLFLGAMFPAT